jgi:hypothetical protein
LQSWLHPRNQRHPLSAATLRRGGGHHAAASILLLGTVVVAVLLMGIFEPMLALAVACSLALCAYPFTRVDFEPISPITFISAYLALAFPLKLLAFRLGMPNVYEDFGGILSTDSAVSKAMWLTVLGQITMMVGFYRVPAILRRWCAPTAATARTLDRAWWRLAATFAGFGFVVLVYRFATGQLAIFNGTGESFRADLNQIFTYSTNYMWLGFICAALYVCGKQKKSFPGSLMMSAVVITCMLIGMLLTMKQWILYPMVWLLLAAYMSGRRIAKKGGMVALVVVVAFAFTFIPAFRDYYQKTYARQNPQLGDLVNTALVVGDQMVSHPVTLLQPLTSLVNRMGGIDNAVLVSQEFPANFHYVNFVQLKALPFVLVPRLIYPNKPRTEDLLHFYTVEVTQSVGTTAMAAHPIAEGYMNHGAFGVVVICWLWGLAAGLLYRGFYLPRRDRPAAQAIYLLYFFDAAGFGQYVLFALLGIPGQMLALAPALYVLFWRGKQQLVTSAQPQVMATSAGYSARP